MTIRDPFTGQPGFSGFSPTAAQSLAYLADMQENGIPVTYGYISDIHERKAGHGRLHDRARRRRPATPSARATAATSAPPRPTTTRSRSSSTGCSKDGITPANTAVRDQRRGERPVRRRQRRPGDPADARRVRRRHRAVQLHHRPDRRTADQHQRRARRHGQRVDTVRHRAAGRGDLRPRPARARPIRRCASCSATPPR